MRWRQRPVAMVGAVLLVFIIGSAVFAPWLAPFSPTERVAAPFLPPSDTHRLGTNDVGQDILSELIFGARTSLLVGATAAGVSIGLGIVAGVVAGYYGGWVDRVVMRIVDVILTLPFLPLLIVLAAFVGPHLVTLILVIGMVSWARPARIIRAHVLITRTLPYLEAARALGSGHVWRMRRHLVPAVLPLAFGQFLLAASGAILIEASLSFLGLGDPTAKSWGTMLYYAQARSAFLTGTWLWWVIPPGLCIAVTVLSMALLGMAAEKE